jgi:thiamine-phosphate pyrophosphorylase
VDAAKSPIVCYVTDRKSLGSADPVAQLIVSIRAALAAGVDWVQIREKDLLARDLLALTAAAIRAAGERREGQTAPARVIVNDRLDVALAAGAAGVHLGRESVPPADVVRWCRGGNAPADFLIGVSCHSLADVREAQAAGASYAFFGPVYETPSKRPFGPPQGIARLAEVCAAIRMPVIAIGGIHAENAAECLRAGASGIAAIRMYQESSEDLPERIVKLHALPLRSA